MNAKQRKERKKDMKAVARDDILRYRFLSELRAAPDGKRAAFVVSEANAEENNYESRLWLYENGEVRQLTDLGQERGFAWLDDELLIFPACRSALQATICWICTAAKQGTSLRSPLRQAPSAFWIKPTLP